MVRLLHLLLAVSAIAAGPAMGAETWPQAVALPELSGSLLPCFWEAKGDVVVPIPQSSSQVSAVLWPKSGHGLLLLDAARQAQLEVRFEKYGEALLVAVYLRRHGREDFVYIKSGRDSSVPLASWIAKPGRWGRLQIEWPASDASVALKLTWEGNMEEFKWANAVLKPCAYVHIPPGVRFARLGFSLDPSSLYP